jgi:hypothetical protein
MRLRLAVAVVDVDPGRRRRSPGRRPHVTPDIRAVRRLDPAGAVRAVPKPRGRGQGLCCSASTWRRGGRRTAGGCRARRSPSSMSSGRCCSSAMTENGISRLTGVLKSSPASTRRNHCSPSSVGRRRSAAPSGAKRSTASGAARSSPSRRSSALMSFPSRSEVFARARNSDRRACSVNRSNTMPPCCERWSHAASRGSRPSARCSSPPGCRVGSTVALPGAGAQARDERSGGLP